MKNSTRQQIQILLILCLSINISASNNDAGLLKQALPVAAGMLTAATVIATLTKSPKPFPKKEIMQAYDQDAEVQNLRKLSSQLRRLESRTIAKNEQDYLDFTLKRNREEEGTAILEYNDQLCIRTVINPQTGNENPSFDDIHVYQKAINFRLEKRFREIGNPMLDKVIMHNRSTPHNGFICYCAIGLGVCVGGLVSIAMQK